MPFRVLESEDDILHAVGSKKRRHLRSRPPVDSAQLFYQTGKFGNQVLFSLGVLDHYARLNKKINTPFYADVRLRLYSKHYRIN